MDRILKLSLFFFPLPFLAMMSCHAQTPVLPEVLLTAPERTAYQRTSTHREVLDVVSALAANSVLLHRESLLTTVDGRDVPLLILANPPITTPSQAQASGKPVIYIQGNIHGGEVEGKEAILMVMRDILLYGKGHLLDNQILAFVPIYNADGNDAMSYDARPNQELSPPLAGERFAHGFDLNRDGMAIDTPETLGLYQNLIQRWDPQLLVDMHTTNGSWHGYDLTYAPSYHTAGDPEPSRYTMDVMLPAIRTAVKENHDLDFYLFGDFSLEHWPFTEFRTFHHAPRYITNSMGLRNRMAILSETFAHDRFYDRIHAARVFIEEILEYTNNHADEILMVNREAEQRTLARSQQAPGGENGVRFEMIPLETPDTILAYEHVPFQSQDGELRYIRRPQMVEVRGVANYNRFTSLQTASVPKSYIFPAALSQIADKLQQHGIRVERLEATQTFSGEVFVATSYTRQAMEQNGHRNLILHGEAEPGEHTFVAGDYRVPMAQPLANLIFYLLEPQSDDGLVYWNFFDEWLISRELPQQEISDGTFSLDYPVFKAME